METTKYIYLRDSDVYIGWLEEFPNYKTQGETLDELKENLLDIYKELHEGTIPHVLYSGELQIV